MRKNMTTLKNRLKKEKDKYERLKKENDKLILKKEQLLRILMPKAWGKLHEGKIDNSSFNKESEKRKEEKLKGYPELMERLAFLDGWIFCLEEQIKRLDYEKKHDYA